MALLHFWSVNTLFRNTTLSLCSFFSGEEKVIHGLLFSREKWDTRGSNKAGSSRSIYGKLTWKWFWIELDTQNRERESEKKRSLVRLLPFLVYKSVVCVKSWKVFLSFNLEVGAYTLGYFFHVTCMSILRPEECLVSLKSRMIRMIEKNSRISAFSRWEANRWRIRST